VDINAEVPEGEEETVGAVRFASVESDEIRVTGLVMPLAKEEEDFLTADVFGSSTDSRLPDCL